MNSIFLPPYDTTHFLCGVDEEILPPKFEVPKFLLVKCQELVCSKFLPPYDTPHFLIGLPPAIV